MGSRPLGENAGLVKPQRLPRCEVGPDLKGGGGGAQGEAEGVAGSGIGSGVRGVRKRASFLEQWVWEEAQRPESRGSSSGPGRVGGAGVWSARSQTGSDSLRRGLWRVERAGGRKRGFGGEGGTRGDGAARQEVSVRGWAEGAPRECGAEGILSGLRGAWDQGRPRPPGRGHGRRQVPGALVGGGGS